AVLFRNLLVVEPPDGLREVEVDALAERPHATPLVAHALGGARRDVARREGAEARIAAAEIVVALRLRDVARRARVAGRLRDPDAAVVAKRLAHQREL